jgi:hypothetical protein
MSKRVEPEKFSEYFGLKKSKDEFDFVDVYANRDIPLFLDPYGISAMDSKWSKQCEQHIATYFQYLIDSIRNGDRRTIQKLLNALHEVDEISLGYSTGTPSGRGIGAEQADQLRDAFENSQAARSGDIRDIADCALLIPGINRDKVSDITANILKADLIEYTQEQCKIYGIPVKKVPVNNVFDFNSFHFKSFYTNLPVINSKVKILLPLSSVRRDPELSKDKYYRDFIIEFLRAEHTHPGDSLAHVLKNGRIKVRIGDLTDKYPKTVDFIYQFTKEHPQILEKYKSELKRSAKKTGTKPTLVPKEKILTAVERIRVINDLKPGNSDAGNFHKISFVNLIYIFGKRLSNPNREKEINEGRKRIDIVFDNAGTKGFFRNLSALYNIQSPKIIVECKNYGKEIGNPEIDQLQGRLNNRRGMFGILLCRSVQNRKAMTQRCRDIVADNKGYIIVLDDSEISILLKLKESSKESEIDTFLTKKLDELIM